MYRYVGVGVQTERDPLSSKRLYPPKPLVLSNRSWYGNSHAEAFVRSVCQSCPVENFSCDLFEIEGNDASQWRFDMLHKSTASAARWPGGGENPKIGQSHRSCDGANAQVFWGDWIGNSQRSRILENEEERVVERSPTKVKLPTFHSHPPPSTSAPRGRNAGKMRWAGRVEHEA